MVEKNTKNVRTRNIALREDVYKALEDARFKHRCRSFNETVSLLLKFDEKTDSDND